jgi:hypothetical protein
MSLRADIMYWIGHNLLNQDQYPMTLLVPCELSKYRGELNKFKSVLLSDATCYGRNTS